MATIRGSKQRGAVAPLAGAGVLTLGAAASGPARATGFPPHPGWIDVTVDGPFGELAQRAIPIGQVEANLDVAGEAAFGFASEDPNSQDTEPGYAVIMPRDGSFKVQRPMRSLADDNGLNCVTTYFSGVDPSNDLFATIDVSGGVLEVDTPSASTASPTVGDSVRFTAPTVDLNGDEVQDGLTYAWSFGDGSTATGPSVAHVFSAPGKSKVFVTASDDSGDAGVSSPLVVHVASRQAAPPPGKPSSPSGDQNPPSSDPGEPTPSQTGEVPRTTITLPAPSGPSHKATRQSNVVRLSRDAGRNGALVLKVRVPGAGRLVVGATTRAKRFRHAAKARTFAYAARVRRTTAGAGTVTLHVRPSRVAARVLARTGRLRVVVTVTFTPAGGRTRTIRTTAHVKETRRR